MSAWRGFCEAVNLTALGVWCGTLVGVGAMAAAIFPVTRALDPRLNQYAAYDGEHWRIVAGRVAQRLFFTADVVQIVCCTLAALALIGLIVGFGRELPRRATLLRAMAMIGAVVTLTIALTAVSPRLNRELRLYWSAAEAGDAAVATAHQRAAAEIHPTASNLYAATAVLVLACLATGAYAASARPAAAKPS